MKLSTYVFLRSTSILFNCHTKSKNRSIVHLEVLELFVDFEIFCVCPSLKNYICYIHVHKLHASIFTPHYEIKAHEEFTG